MNKIVGQYRVFLSGLIMTGCYMMRSKPKPKHDIDDRVKKND